MKISFDVLPLISENMSGIGYCEAGLVGDMIKSHPEDSYTLDYFSRKDHEVKRNRLKAYMQNTRMLPRMTRAFTTLTRPSDLTETISKSNPLRTAHGES